MIDILAIGAHPDDIELGCGGLLLHQKSLGDSICMLDLTKGELGTRGTADIRQKEASVASEIIGVTDRINLGFRDGFFDIDEHHVTEVVRIIRLKKPQIILCNSIDDRHPDHSKAAELVRKSCFYSGLLKFETDYMGEKQEVWRPKALYHYIQFKYIRPDFLYDITPHYEQKMKAIKAHASQFYNPESREPETLISSQEFLDFLEARMIEFGRIIGVKYAEGFNVSRIPSVDNIHSLK